MNTLLRRPLAALAATALGLGLVACGDDDPAGADDAGAAAGGETRTIVDNDGEKTVPAEPAHVVATDNRIFRTLEDFGVELAAAPKKLLPPTSGYADDDAVVDLGNHREPDLEAVVAAEPDLILNGQRFGQYKEDLARLAPDAALVDLDVREDEPLADELIRQTEVLGEIFGKEERAAELVDEFRAAIDRARSAYDPEQTVLGVITSGGDVNYSAPGVGRGVGPVFDMLDLTPALDVDDATHDHMGDDISVEAIAEANPDWLLVMDRDAAIKGNDPEFQPAAELISSSPALARVAAVTADRIAYMPAHTYLDESIQTYTEFLNQLAEQLERASA